MDGAQIRQETARRPRKERARAACAYSDTILQSIATHGILGSLTEQDRLTLLHQSQVRTLPKNRVLFRSGDGGRSVVLILQGYVKLSTMGANGREVLLEIAGPGTIFGELAALNGTDRRADATTLTACQVMAIEGGVFRHALARTPDAMLAAIRLVSERLAATTMQGIDAISLPAPVRLAKALLHLAELDSRQANGAVHIGFRLSQRELGAMTGVTRESINKHLKEWRAAGWIELSSRAVTLRNISALKDFVRDNEAR